MIDGQLLGLGSKQPGATSAPRYKHGALRMATSAATNAWMRCRSSASALKSSLGSGTGRCCGQRVLHLCHLVQNNAARGGTDCLRFCGGQIKTQPGAQKYNVKAASKAMIVPTLSTVTTKVNSVVKIRHQ
eukprot:2388787-Karenia_brevis.AAC.2